jgi:hypothetical protein
VKTYDKVWSLSVAGSMVGAFVALILSPAAQADPEIPAPPPPAEQSITVQAAPAEPAPPAEVPHLLSPENLPPGTSAVPVDPPDGRGVSYLRDLWHAVQTQDISGRDALLLLTQRPLDPNAVPTNGLAAGPQPLTAAGTAPDAPAPDAPAPDAPAPDAPAPDLPPPGPLPGPAPTP